MAKRPLASCQIIRRFCRSRVEPWQSKLANFQLELEHTNDNEHNASASGFGFGCYSRSRSLPSPSIIIWVSGGLYSKVEHNRNRNRNCKMTASNLQYSTETEPGTWNTWQQAGSGGTVSSIETRSNMANIYYKGS